MASPPGEEEIVMPATGRLVLIMVAISLASLLIGMDQTILATATPRISDEFDVIDDIGWWLSAYLLTLSSFQLFYGKLYTVFSIKLVYLVAIVLFMIGSLICTTAPNSVALIVGRAIAGLGGAGIFSGGMLITAKLIPLDKRATYIGIVQGAFGFAAILGPFIGGAIVGGTTWRWVFGINLPLGAVIIAAVIFFVQIPTPPELHTTPLDEKIRLLDIPGTVFMIGSLICLLIALQWGGATYPWNNGRVIALFVVFGVLAIIFVVVEKTKIFGTARTVPNSIVKNRDIWFGASHAICTTAAIYVPVLYLPVWFQTVHGYSAISSGGMLAPFIAGYVVCAIVAGGLTTGVGYYNPAMILGTALAIAGAALLTTLDTGSSTANIVGYQLLFGFGVGFAVSQGQIVAQTVLPTPDVPVGVSMLIMLQNVGGAVFVAVAQTVFQTELRRRLQDISPDLNVPVAVGAGAAGVTSNVPPEYQDPAREALSASLILTCYIPLALSAASVVGAVCTRWVSMKKASDVAPEDSPPESAGENGDVEKKENGTEVTKPT